ncbi:MAG: glycosyltransferase family 4 protein [Planctomycetota bacterium]
MRICLFTPTFLPSLGGAERMADTLARGLTERGHALCVLAPRPRPDAGPAPEARHPSPGSPGLPYAVARYRRPPAQHLWPELLAWRLRRLHRRWPFDVVLAFYAYPTGYAATRAARRLRTPVVVTPRGADLYPLFHALRKPRVKATIAAGYRDADRIVSISNWLTQRIVQVTGRTLEQLPPIDAVPNGIDLQAFDADLAAADPGRLPLDEDTPFLLHMGRVVPVKQVDVAVKAVARCAAALRERGVRYAIVGDGADLEPLRAQIAQQHLSDTVLTLGRRSGAERAWLLRHARGFVTASREEGMPNAVLEAMAAGLPTLASDIGPHRELLEDRGWGLLHRAGDPEDLAQRLLQLLDTPAAPLREAALALREHYTLEKTIAGYEAACQKALASRRL